MNVLSIFVTSNFQCKKQDNPVIREHKIYLPLDRMHYATVKVRVAVGDINPKYPLITQPDYVSLLFKITYVLGFVAFLLFLNAFC